MPMMTHAQIMRQHLRRLELNERCLLAELRRVEHGLAAVREQIARERRALSDSSESGGDFPGPRAA